MFKRAARGAAIFMLASILYKIIRNLFVDRATLMEFWSGLVGGQGWLIIVILIGIWIVLTTFIWLFLALNHWLANRDYHR